MTKKDDFDAPGFYAAIEAAVNARGITWKQLAEATGVSATTLARMATGRNPDAASVAALSAWAGLNLADFVGGNRRKKKSAGTLEIVSDTLRSDPALDAESAKALESIFQAAYRSMRKKSE
jgi:transcriptional regulator with XRE-family HTH domain